MKGLEIWQAFNKSAKIAVVVLLGFLATSVWHSCSSESEIDQWRTDFNNFRDNAQASAVALTDSLNARTDSVIAIVETSDERADSLTFEITERDDEIENLQDRAEVIIVATDSTFGALTSGQDVETVVEENVPQAEPWIRLVYGLHEVNGILIQANIKFSEQVFDLEQRDKERVIAADALRAGLMFQTQRADLLQIIVLNIPTGPPIEKLLGFIPLPSRQTSFILGGITAIVGYITFDKWLSNGEN